MASYTIIQNVEAEDKIIGPLSVKKLFWALLAAALCWLAWYLGSHISYYLIIPFALVTPIFYLLSPATGERSTQRCLAGSPT